MQVKVRRLPAESEHDAQKWLVIEGYIEGVPAVTKRDSINIAALASGDVLLSERVAKMRADVEEYYARWRALADLPSEL